MIRDFSYFPFVLPSGELRPGILATPNRICESCPSRECARTGYNRDRIATVGSCSKGLNFVYAADFTGEDIVWAGFLCRRMKYPDNYRHLLRHGFELDQPTINRVIGLFSNGGNAHRLVVDNQKRGQSRALHDLKHLVTALVRVVETNDIRRVTERRGSCTPGDVELMRDTISSVFNILGALKNQIEMADYILAPDASEFSKEVEIDIFPLFDKHVHIYNVLASQSQKSIRIVSNSGYMKTKRTLQATFLLLPAILLENAIKYSQVNTVTNVALNEDNNGKLRISVCFVGPIVPESERTEIWKEGKQYIHQDDTSKGGSGFGLYLARRICDRVGFSITYEGNANTSRRGIPVGSNSFVLSEL
jgi:hypothetical protein